MLKISRIFLAIVIIVLSSYSLIFDQNSLLPFMQFLLGLLALVMGLTELKEKRTRMGILLLLTSAFVYVILVADFI